MNPEHSMTPDRYVVIVDRGWIFAGDLTEMSNGYVRLARAVHVFGWESIGFAAMVESPSSKKVDLRQMSQPVEVPPGSIIFRVPVDPRWGLSK